MKHEISKQTMQRLPQYLHYLKTLSLTETPRVSATRIADALKLNQVQVRKDLAAVSSSGRPKVGYDTGLLITELERFLGYLNTNNAILVGVGRLGTALLEYNGFTEYGLHMVAAFDNDPRRAYTRVDEKSILPLSEMKAFCEKKRIRIAVLTVPRTEAQGVTDLLIDCGILAIWNFAPVPLQVPDGILVQNENMAASLALLSKHLAQKLAQTRKT